MPFALLKYGLSADYPVEVDLPPPCELKPRYDVVIIGGGGHGLATAYYLAKYHGVTNVAVLEKAYLGGGNTARNTAVKFSPGNPRYAALPDDYFAKAAEIKSPILFIQGQDNRVFADSNIRCFERIDKVAPGRHKLHVFPGYGHQDIFMGKDVATDIFPTLLSFLREHAHD